MKSTKRCSIEQAVAAYKEHGTKPAAAAALGVSVAQVSYALKLAADNGNLDSPKELLAGNESKVNVWEGANNFILTCAQGGVDVNLPFYQNLTAYARERGAHLMVAPVVYDTRPQMNTKETDDTAGDPYTWKDCLLPHLTNERERLAPTFEFTANLNILPTAVNPVSGVRHPPLISSAVPHQKRALEVLPVADGGKPVYRMTTGSVTQPRHIQRRAGQAAEFHHVFGALFVGVDADGAWFARQITADSEGSFYDLDYSVRHGMVSKGSHCAASLVIGDWHDAGVNTEVANLVFHDGDSMNAVLRPRHVLLHDVFDGRACNPHSRWGERFRTAMGHGLMSVKQEVKDLCRTLDDLAHLTPKLVIVPSNHDDFLNRWLDTHDYRSNPADAQFFIELERERLRAYHLGEPFNALLSAVEIVAGVNPHTQDSPLRFLYPDDSLVIGGVEHGLHGHKGPNGAKGSAMNLSRTARKITIGHTHVPQIREGVYVAGHACERRQGYNSGPSSWDFANVVQYPDNHRAILSMWENADGTLRWKEKK